MVGKVRQGRQGQVKEITTTTRCSHDLKVLHDSGLRRVGRQPNGPGGARRYPTRPRGGASRPSGAAISADELCVGAARWRPRGLAGEPGGAGPAGLSVQQAGRRPSPPMRAFKVQYRDHNTGGPGTRHGSGITESICRGARAPGGSRDPVLSTWRAKQTRKILKLSENTKNLIPASSFAIGANIFQNRC